MGKIYFTKIEDEQKERTRYKPTPLQAVYYH